MTKNISLEFQNSINNNSNKNNKNSKTINNLFCSKMTYVNFKFQVVFLFFWIFLWDRIKRDLETWRVNELIGST